MSDYKIAPSILSADFANLERDLHAISHAEMAHVDVMDYHFVPNLTIGVPVVERLVQVAKNVPIEIDVHLMIEDPDRWAPAYAEMGADSVTFHMNAAAAPLRLAREIRKLDSRASIAVRPAEPVEPLFDILDEFDMILIMTVEPGFGGQKFLANQMQKVKRLREVVNARGLQDQVMIQVDGGVSRDTVEVVAKAGANVSVAGSAVYSKEDRNAEIDLIRAKGKAAYDSVWG